jgi:hypothetical protein
LHTGKYIRPVVPNQDPAMPDTALVPLTKGMFAIIDAADAAVVGSRNWQARKGGTKGRTFYAVCARKGRPTTFLHRFLWAAWGLPEPEELDHVNWNGLDCRRQNLRPATHVENTNNQPMRSTNTSGFAGVDFVKSAGKWRARIAAMGRKRSLGYFHTAEEAGAAYIAASVQLRGQFSAHVDE